MHDRRGGSTSPRPSLLRLLLASAGLVLAAACLLPVELGAQDGTGTVLGRVVDASRLEPVGHAEITLAPGDRRTVSDAEGRFRFEEVPAGEYELRVRFLGYETAVRELVVEADEPVEIEVRVAPGPVTVEDLDVSALALSWFPGFLERREERTGHFFTRQEIIEADPGYLTQLLRDREGVRIGFNRRAHGHEKRYPQFEYTGPGAGLFCYPAIFVNGETIGPGQPYWHFNEIPPERALAMEVYYRERDIPEDIAYTEYREARGREAPRPEEPGAGPIGAATGSQLGDGFRRVLAGAGLLDLLRRPVPRRDEQLAFATSVSAGLYPERPRIEGCGAIFVWTEFYPFGDG